MQGEQAEYRFDGAGGTEGVTEGGFGRTEFGRTGAEDAVERLGFGAVVEGCAGAVGVDVADLRGSDAAFFERLSHGAFQRGTVGRGLGEVMRIGGVSVTGKVAEDWRTAGTGAVSFFEDKKRGAFAEHESAATTVEGTASIGGEGLESIETGEDEFGQRFVTAGKDQVCHARAEKICGVADGVGAAGAGVGDGHDGSVEPEGVMDRADLCLGLVVGDAGGLAAARLAPKHAEEFFALFHTAGGGADGHFEARLRGASIRVE